MKKKLIKAFIYVLGALAIGFIIIKTDWNELAHHIGSISPKVIIFSLPLQCLTIVLLNMQWRSMALLVDREASFWKILMVNVKGNIIDAVTPGVKAGGELARVFELRKRLKVEFVDATIIVGLQKSISLLSFLFLTLCSMIWFSFTMGIKYRYYLYLFSIVIAIFSLLLAIIILFSLKPDMMIKLLNRLFGGFRFMLKIEKALRDYSSILTSLLRNKRKFLGQMLLGIFIWMFYAFKLLLVMRGFNIEMDYISIAAITFLTYIMGMIPLLPGSIGSFESSMLVLLRIKGVPMEVGLSIAFIFRFITFWFELIISCIILILDHLLAFHRKGDKDVGIKM